ncbi:BUD13 homolog [Oppia nitens]|uniref:BUD13 homolog n=1 Tax=Oppia nitens TaxID=1686743 RepID=UPI0023DCC70C|nr:BUD13 homolog [Oppia nitens]
MSGKSYDRPVEHKEYIRLKYMTSNDSKNEEKIKKKKRIKKLIKPKTKKIHIFDDDIDLKKIDKNGSDDELYFGTKEEKPQIAAVVDERPLHMRRKDLDTNRWKTIEPVVDSSVVNDKASDSNKRLRHESDDDSTIPSRRLQQHDSDDSDLAPPRNRTSNRQRHDSDSDLSPVRASNRQKSKNNINDDLSPPRHKSTKQTRHDSDSDLSPIRETKAPKRQRSRHDDEDLSPPRSRQPNRSQRHDSGSDLSPPRSSRNDTHKPKPKTTLSGKKAGLSDGKHLREELMNAKKKEQILFESISDEMLGKNAKTVFRDSKSGKIRDLDEEARVQREKDSIKDKIEAEKKAKYDKWSKGLVQKKEQQEKRESNLHEMSKPLARYEDDADLDKMLREQERDDDPMLQMIRKNKEKVAIKEGTFKVRPAYKGPTAPLNRFNIQPGYRWDGVDRSNGFEKRHFDRIANRMATQDEAYKWATEDM